VLLFLVPVTLVMHNFWALQGQADLEMHPFLGNVVLAGPVLMFLLIPPPRTASVDRRLATRRTLVPGRSGRRTA
jgi:hypothetical protein